MLRTEILTFIASISICLMGGVAPAKDQIKIAVARHRPTNIPNYDDYVWKKYGIGERLRVTDPSTGQPRREIRFPLCYAQRHRFDRPRLNGHYAVDHRRLE